MAYAKDPRVDEYFKPLLTWQQEICERVRDLVHEADPELEETIGRAPDPEGVITDGHGNVSGRQIKVRSGDELNEPALLPIFRAIVADNRAGGWRKLKAERGE